MKPDPRAARPWPFHASERGPDLVLFRVRHDRFENPRTGQELRALILETPEWVNVVPVTAGGEILMVRQFRFGTRKLTLEIPGGVVNPGEDPRQGAERELREETGCSAERWTYLGSVEPNPAFHTNRCHHFLATGVQRTSPQELDAGEDIEVLSFPSAKVTEMVAAGEIQNSMVVTALSRVLDLRRVTLPTDRE